MESEITELISKDGTSLSCIFWDCPDPIGVVCLVHGLGEHYGRYEHVAEFFTSNKLAVFAYDQKGHGRSGGKRGHTSSYDLLLDDVEELLKTARAEYNDLPIILYGHSFGGNVVTNYLLRRSTDEIACGIISSPLFKLTKEPPEIQIKAAKFVSKIFPSFSQPNGLNVQDISTDPEAVKAYSEDPLVHDRISTRLFTVVYEAGFWAIENADRLKTPTLVFHGSDDNITSHQGSKEFVQKSNGSAVFKSWEGMKHETHNDLKKEEVIHHMYDWIVKTLKLI